MANTSTLVGTLPISCYGSSAVYMYTVTIDTVDTDLTVRTAAAGKMHAIVGLVHDDNTNHIMTFKSGTTSIARFEKTASYQFTIGGGIMLATKPGEALVIRSTAAVDLLLVYVLETDQILIR
jgi:hypothetical protein